MRRLFSLVICLLLCSCFSGANAQTDTVEPESEVEETQEPTRLDSPFDLYGRQASDLSDYCQDPDGWTIRGYPPFVEMSCPMFWDDNNYSFMVMVVLIETPDIPDVDAVSVVVSLQSVANGENIGPMMDSVGVLVEQARAENGCDQLMMEQFDENGLIYQGASVCEDRIISVFTDGSFVDETGAPVVFTDMMHHMDDQVLFQFIETRSMWLESLK